LNAVGYTVDQIPPTKSDTAYPICGGEIENNINRNFDYEPFTQCGDDLFMIHYTGFITIPAHTTIRFWVAADDGGTVKIGTEEFGDWGDKGCSAIETELQIEAGPQPLDAWFYENGGGTCFMLAWQIDDGEWQIVPDEAFIRGAVPEVTTTTSSTTTTTTTEVPTTTTSSTLPEPSTTIKPTTGTTTKPAVGNEETTTTLPLVSTTIETTTTTTVPETTTTTPPTTILETTTTTQPATTTTDAPVKTSNVTSTTIAPTTTTTTLVATTTTIEQNVPTTTLVETPAQAVAELLEIDEPTAQEVDAIVEQIDLLTPAQIEQVVEVLNKANNKVKKHFEQTVNVYSGKFDSYIPANQTIPVKERRTLIAITGSLVSLGATAQNRKTRR
jgi:hypothetical protein